jgi:hypothetical protein
MCLICVEYFYQRMTKDEVKNALPEMVMFAKTEEERNHFKKLQSMESVEEMTEEAKAYVSKNPEPTDKYDYKVSYKTRRL